MHKYLKHLTLACALAAATLAASAVTPNAGRSRGAAAAKWADSVYNTLSERQRLGQLLFPQVIPTKGADSKAFVRRLVERDGVGGLIFTEGTLAQHADIMRYAQSVAQVPLMMTIDGEWGVAMRLEDMPKFPYNMALGAITDYKLLYEYGQEVARQCRLLGIHVNFAPVADVNSNPSNPVIGYRSFGEDPARVAKAVTAYSLGLEDGGVQSVAKHFPGHGDTATDSHKAATVVSHDRAQLDKTDLVPFVDYINAGCSGIMTGHIAVPVLDASGTPASLSQIMTTDLLRKQMGFEGLIYTDALGMRGVTAASSAPAVDALIAGADVLLCPPNADKALASLVAAVNSGKISRAVVEDRCKRVLRYKYLYDAANTASADKAALAAQVNSAEAQALMQRLANASVTVVRNEGNLLPLDIPAGKKISVINIGAKADNDFSDICSHYAPVSAHYTMGGAFSAQSLAKVTAGDMIVVGVYDDKEGSRAALAQIMNSTAKPVAVVFFVSPYKMKKFTPSLGGAKAIVEAYDNLPVCRIAGAEALFGGIATAGKLPAAIPGIAAIGTGIELPKTRLGFTSPVAEGFAPWLTDSITAMAQEGIRTGAFPACQILVARNGNIVYDRAFGKLSNTATAPKATRQTIFDLASVSKATGTLPGIMKAFDQGLFTLEDSLAMLIPEVTDPGKKPITMRMLLHHETGMPASLNVYDAMFDTTTFSGSLLSSKRDASHGIKIQRNLYGHNRARLRRDITSPTATDALPTAAAKGLYVGKSTFDTLMHRIYDIPLRDDRSYNYSCLNFCLLMDIEQRLTGRRHDTFVRDEIFAPLGAYRTGYRAADWDSTANVAATEFDSYMRRQTVTGYVHDELAAMSGGIQGNAGLFSNADDLAKLCQMLLNGGTYGGKRLLSQQTVDLFLKDKSPTCRRGLGFDKPNVEHPEWSPTCDEAGPAVVGHLGFTGTVFWIDPAEDMIYIFLCNRVNPTRDNDAFNNLPIRPTLFAYMYRALADRAEQNKPAAE